MRFRILKGDGFLVIELDFQFSLREILLFEFKDEKYVVVSFQFSLREIRTIGTRVFTFAYKGFQFSLREILELEFEEVLKKLINAFNSLFVRFGRGSAKVNTGSSFQFSLREILKAYIGVPSAGLLTLYVSCLP